MSLLDSLGKASFAMGGATPFVRMRAGRKPDPYDPGQQIEDWDHPDELRLRGALASSSSTRTPDALRDQTSSTAYLTVNDPLADVRVGDRIRADPDDGRKWEVSGFPSKDVNAFTGWQPTLEIALSEWRG